MILYYKKNPFSSFFLFSLYIIGKYKCCCCELTDITQSKFHCGHIISEVNGGELHVDNLKPICARCNLSMSNNFTIAEWNKLNGKQKNCCIIC